MLYALWVGGGIWSARFVQIDNYLPLVPLLVAPSISLAAHLLEG